ncbi:hypothetical protein ACEPPN_010761 [Leptodophora sp. 'Broadleaf-Isolate-01']
MAEQLSESRRLSQEMRQHVENSNDFDTRFMPNGKLEHVLDEANLTTLFQEYLVRRGSNASAAKYAAKTIGGGNRCGPRLKLLAIIIFGNVDQNLEKFVDWLERDFSGVPSDERLPLKDANEVMHWFGDGAERFLEIQPIFNPHIYTDKTPLYVEKSEERFYRHPLIGNPVRMGEGAFSLVEMITVATGHFVEDGTPSTRAISLARKVFENQELAREANPDFANEESILAQLEAQPWVHHNLMRNRGSIVVQEGAVDCRCTLLYDLATSNLRDVLVNPDASKLLARASLDDKYQLIHYFTDLVDGVDHFHDASLIHMDIKWDNILVMTVLGKTSWRLADYNLCKLKTRKIHQNATSSTKSRRPPGVFQAPEVRGTEDGNVGWWSDYWSLGCLLIYLLAYLDDGANAIENLEKDLQKYDPVYGRFYSMAKTTKNPKVNKGFKKFCKSLCKNAQARDLQAGRRGEGEGSLVNTMLKFVEEHIFIVDRKQRKMPESKTHHFAQMMKQTKKGYEHLKNGDFDSPSEMHSSVASFLLHFCQAGKSQPTSVRPVVSEPNDQTGGGTPASQHDELPGPSGTRTPPEPPQLEECSLLCKAVTNSSTRSLENLSALNDAHVSMASPTEACPKCRAPPLHTLISRFYVPHCEALLNTLLEHMRGADLNCKDRHGRTPLQAALKKGNLGVCKLLLERHTRWDVQIDWTYISNHWHEYNPDVKTLLDESRCKASAKAL